MLQYILLLCACAVPDIRALAVPAIEATAEDPKCLDITHCRTLPNIVWTCFLTIFACTWVSIHRNVTGLSTNAIGDLVDRVGITVLTILVPEWTLAWAIRQWLVACEIAKEFNQLSSALPHASVDDGVTAGLLVSVMDIITPPEKSTSEETEPWSRSISTVAGLCKTLGSTVARLWKILQRVFHIRFPTNGPWTTAHGFCVLMGGFHFVNGYGPSHPASREDLKHIIETRPFTVPNKLFIGALNTSDAFSKAVTVLQTLWFVMQCIARAIQHLPITNLEIATLAYTTITFAMYSFWFQKPQNVVFPIPLKEIARSDSLRSGDSSSLLEVGWGAQIKRFVRAVVGQDNEVQLSKLLQVPIFYAGNPKEGQVLFAYAIAMTVGAIFGAVHCIAWSFAFPSQTEKLLWRISAVITTVIPLGYVVFVVLVAFEVKALAKLAQLALLFSAVSMPLYIVARAVLLVLTFTTLRDLLPAAYESIHWMSFIPHV